MNNMLQIPRVLVFRSKLCSSLLRKQTFLTNAYSCTEAWNSRDSSPSLNKVNLNDFYTILDQNYMYKGVISATDVDIFANAIKDSGYLDELRDLLHKLRQSADTGNTLESTHYATVRNFIDYGNIQDVIEILRDPLTYGIFLNGHTANMLLNKLVTCESYEQAAAVASIVMLQEDYSNEITCALSRYACYKFILGYTPPGPVEPEKTKQKVEEIKIRIKFLRNPYFDDHFDLKDPLLLSGKTLAWMSKSHSNQLNNNLQLIGWLYYKKYDELVTLCKQIAKNESSKIYPEVKDLLQKECSRDSVDQETVAILEKSLSLLSKVNAAEMPLEEALKISIENVINKSQTQDISKQEQLFKSWAEIRESKLNEQIKRLDRARRLQLIQENQQKMKEEEQKLWFFENEEQIDLQIEEKEKLQDKSVSSKSTISKIDENYIPPEIIPKRK